MKTLKLFCLLVLIAARLSAQKVSYSSGVIQVDGKDLAHVVKIKGGNFGMTNSFELDALSGEKLIMASFDSDYPTDPNDNSRYYYKFTFLTTNQEAVFTLSVFGPEKSFAKLIGASGIVVNDKLDSVKVKDFIALKGQKAAPAATTQSYDIPRRNYQMMVFLKTDHTIVQEFSTLGSFKDVSNDSDEDKYEFSIPNGLVIATVRFKGGLNATRFDIATIKDGMVHSVTIPVGNSKTIISSIDRNESTIHRVTQWLVDNNFL
jgi:hypothetical protein